MISPQRQKRIDRLARLLTDARSRLELAHELEIKAAATLRERSATVQAYKSTIARLQVELEEAQTHGQ